MFDIGYLFRVHLTMDVRLCSCGMLQVYLVAILMNGHTMMSLVVLTLTLQYGVGFPSCGDDLCSLSATGQPVCRVENGVSVYMPILIH